MTGGAEDPTLGVGPVEGTAGAGAMITTEKCYFVDLIIRVLSTFE